MTDEQQPEEPTTAAAASAAAVSSTTFKLNFKKTDKSKKPLVADRSALPTAPDAAGVDENEEGDIEIVNEFGPESSRKAKKAPAPVIPMIEGNSWMQRARQQRKRKAGPPDELTDDDDTTKTKSEPATATNGVATTTTTAEGSSNGATNGGGGIAAGDDLRQRAKALLISESSDTDGITAAATNLYASAAIDTDTTNAATADEVLGSDVAADYDSIPIESFGMAMLRGMGWSEGKPIGQTRKGVYVQPAINIRPKGLGLGAESHLKKQKAESKASEKGAVEGESLQLRVGSTVRFVSGPQEGAYGTVVSLDEDSVRACVKLAVSQNVESVSQFTFVVVTAAEYKENSKVINKREYDKYKAQSAAGTSTNGHAAPSEKPKKSKSKQRSSPVPIELSDSEPDVLWLRPDLRVRVVDQTHRLYKEKVRVVDVASIEHCQCETSSGAQVEFGQRQLETVVPKRPGSVVQLLTGAAAIRPRLVGRLARVVELDKRRALATVQLIMDSSACLTTSYDHICEYTGPVDL